MVSCCDNELLALMYNGLRSGLAVAGCWYMCHTLQFQLTGCCAHNDSCAVVIRC